MATITIAPYSHEVYHNVTKPSLYEAIQGFRSSNAMQYINTVIRDCFLKHNLQKQFTACINHRHFDISPNERNIEEDDGSAFGSADLDGIIPCTWLFHEGKLYPYEFKRGAEEESNEPPLEFVNELGTILEKHGLCDVIGLQAYTDGIVGMEKTDHERNVSTTRSFPEGAPELQDPRNAVVASFAFF
ncbi:hypothetical protein BJY04DRAFT_180916 [Aspergillus karnatakaensis]|uniref:uncharacterized protein n=1 Tax=Aspergillus karnatakaensis TaxID=1810916 RepID=UPI003CCCD04E